MIFRSDERLFERAAQMSAYFLEGLFSLKDVPIVTDIRGYGMMGGVDVAPMGGPGQRGYQWQKRMFESGLHIKTTGDAAVVAPPFVMETGHIDQMIDVMRTTLRAL